MRCTPGLLAGPREPTLARMSTLARWMPVAVLCLFLGCSDESGNGDGGTAGTGTGAAGRGGSGGCGRPRWQRRWCGRQRWQRWNVGLQLPDLFRMRDDQLHRRARDLPGEHRLQRDLRVHPHVHHEPPPPAPRRTPAGAQMVYRGRPPTACGNQGCQAALRVPVPWPIVGPARSAGTQLQIRSVLVAASLRPVIRLSLGAVFGPELARHDQDGDVRDGGQRHHREADDLPVPGHQTGGNDGPPVTPARP